MVEELSRWKSALSSRTSELRDILKKLLDERLKIREMSLKTYHSLNLLNEHLPKHTNEHVLLKSTNTVDLSIANQKLSEVIEQNLLKELPDPRKHHILEGMGYTHVESIAIHILKNPMVISDRPDICKAVMGAANAIGGGQMFLQHPEMQATCCAHCKGEVENI